MLTNLILILISGGWLNNPITQSAAFMKRNRMPLERYLESLEKYEQNMKNFLGTGLQDLTRDPGFPNSGFQTWKISFDRLDVKNLEQLECYRWCLCLSDNKVQISAAATKWKRHHLSLCHWYPWWSLYLFEGAFPPLAGEFEPHPWDFTRIADD